MTGAVSETTDVTGDGGEKGAGTRRRNGEGR